LLYARRVRKANDGGQLVKNATVLRRAGLYGNYLLKADFRQTKKRWEIYEDCRRSMARHFQISILLMCSLVSFTFCMFSPRITSQQRCQKQKRNNPVSQFSGQKSCLIQQNRERRILGYWIQNQYLAPARKQLTAPACSDV
jgi:hypothetical protein